MQDSWTYDIPVVRRVRAHNGATLCLRVDRGTVISGGMDSNGTNNNQLL